MTIYSSSYLVTIFVLCSLFIVKKNRSLPDYFRFLASLADELGIKAKHKSWAVL